MIHRFRDVLDGWPGLRLLQPLKDDLTAWRSTSDPPPRQTSSSRHPTGPRGAPTELAAGASRRSPKPRRAPTPQQPAIRSPPQLHQPPDRTGRHCRRGRPPGRTRPDDDPQHLRTSIRRAGRRRSPTGRGTDPRRATRNHVPQVSVLCPRPRPDLTPGTEKPSLSSTFPEPASGLEPETFSLQVKCSTN
jgi:hypothetical protein